MFDIEPTTFQAKDIVNDDLSSLTNEHAEETIAMLRDQVKAGQSEIKLQEKIILRLTS